MGNFRAWRAPTVGFWRIRLVFGLAGDDTQTRQTEGPSQWNLYGVYQKRAGNHSKGCGLWEGIMAVDGTQSLLYSFPSRQ